jgi:hypothetical protein
LIRAKNDSLVCDNQAKDFGDERKKAKVEGKNRSKYCVKTKKRENFTLSRTCISYDDVFE